MLLGFSASYVTLMVSQEKEADSRPRLNSIAAITIDLPFQTKVSNRAEPTQTQVLALNAPPDEADTLSAEIEPPLVMASGATPPTSPVSSALNALGLWAFDPNPALPVEPRASAPQFSAETSNAPASKEPAISAPTKAPATSLALAKLKTDTLKTEAAKSEAPKPAPISPAPNSPSPMSSERRMANLSPRAKTASEGKSGDSRSIFEKWFARDPEDSVQALAYAQPNEGEIRSNSVLRRENMSPSQDRFTAIYDIEARTVYLPNGEALEAHSGLGNLADDPRYVHVKNRGSTPPNLYKLTERESLFHGIRALRLTPQGDAKMYGRDGILAHSYMLGGNGQSNGCVSFRDYNKFLQAFLRGEINQIRVVERRG